MESKESIESINTYFSELAHMLQTISQAHLQQVLSLLEDAYYNGHRIFIIGNGGSAATASHFALDLAKNTITPGAPRLKAISLTDHVPLITAWSNDTAYEHIFEEQLTNMIEPGDVVIGISTSGNSPNVINEHIFEEQLTNMIEPGDVVIGISTSGNSPNVINAMRLAKQTRAATIGLLGAKGGLIKNTVDAYILAPGQNIEQEEDAHMILTHVITRHMRAVVQSYAQELALAGKNYR